MTAVRACVCATLMKWRSGIIHLKVGTAKLNSLCDDDIRSNRWRVYEWQKCRYVGINYQIELHTTTTSGTCGIEHFWYMNSVRLFPVPNDSSALRQRYYSVSWAQTDSRKSQKCRYKSMKERWWTRKIIWRFVRWIPRGRDFRLHRSQLGAINASRRMAKTMNIKMAYSAKRKIYRIANDVPTDVIRSIICINTHCAARSV